MTKLLQEAIETLRDLPEDEQDAAAEAVLAYITNDERLATDDEVTQR